MLVNSKQNKPRAHPGRPKPNEVKINYENRSFFLNKIVYHLFLMRYKAKREHREKTFLCCMKISLTRSICYGVETGKKEMLSHTELVSMDLSDLK